MSRRVAYFDCFCGISGDMILGALLDTGLEIERLRQSLALLGLEGYALAARPVVKGAIGGTAASVEVLRDEPVQRHLADVLAIIDRSGLDTAVKARAGRVFRLLAEAEARVHRVGVEAIHFHEVGAVDATVDVVGSVAGLSLLGVQDIYCSPLPMAHGWAAMAHGVLPLPAPAVLELLATAGLPTVAYAGGEQLELVTVAGRAPRGLWRRPPRSLPPQPPAPGAR